MHVIISHVEKGIVLPGCPKPQEHDTWTLRPGYPAPWPLEGISHLMKDGFTYSAEPQSWANGPFKLCDNTGDDFAWYEGPPQISEALSASKAARLQPGHQPHQVPQAPQEAQHTHKP